MRRFVHVISFVAGIGLIVLMAVYVGVDETVAHVRTVRLGILLPVTAAYCCAWYLRAHRFQRLMRVFDRDLSFAPALCVEIGGNFANLIAPAKLGDVVKLLYLKKQYGLPYAQGTLAAVLVRVIDLTTVLVLILATVLFLSHEVVEGFGSYIAIGIAVLAMLAGGGAVLSLRPSLFYLLFIGPARRFLPLFRNMHRTFTANLSQFAAILVLSVLVWLLDSLVLQLFLWSLHVELGFVETIFVLMVANLVKTLPITPGAIGVLEGVLVGLLTAFDVDKSVAFAVSILDHGYKNLFTLALGALFLKHLGFSLGGAARLRASEQIET